MQQSDEAAASRTATLLGLDQSDQTILPATPTVEDLQNVLSRVQRQGLVDNPAVLQVRFTSADASGASDGDGPRNVSLVPQDFQQLDPPNGADSSLSEHFSPKVLLRRAADQRYASANDSSNVNALLWSFSTIVHNAGEQWSGRGFLS